LSVLFLQHRAASIENQADSYTGRANNGLLQVFALCSEQVEIVGATYGQECRCAEFEGTVQESYSSSLLEI